MNSNVNAFAVGAIAVCLCVSLCLCCHWLFYYAHQLSCIDVMAVNNGVG